MSIRFEFLALIMVVMLLVGSRVYFFDNPADDTHVSIYIYIYISCEIVVWLLYP